MWTRDKDRMPPCEVFTLSYIVCPKSSLLTYITGQREETLPFNYTFVFGELAKFLFFWWWVNQIGSMQNTNFNLGGTASK